MRYILWLCVGVWSWGAYSQPYPASFFWRYAWLDAEIAATSSPLVYEQSVAGARYSPWQAPPREAISVQNGIYHGGLTAHRVAWWRPGRPFPFWEATFVNYAVQAVRYDEAGLPQGYFNAWEGSLTTMFILDSVAPLRVATVPALLLTQLDRYFALGVATDLNVVWTPAGWTVLFRLANVGLAIDRLTRQQRRFLVPEMAVHALHKLKYAPLVLSFSAQHLQFPVLAVDQEVRWQNTSDSLWFQRLARTAHNILRHFAFGARILIHPKLHLLVGYDFTVRYALAPTVYGGGLTGLTFGIKFRRKGLTFAYGHRFYYPGGGPHYFSLALQLDWLWRRWSANDRSS